MKRHLQIEGVCQPGGYPRGPAQVCRGARRSADAASGACATVQGMTTTRTIPDQTPTNGTVWDVKKLGQLDRDVRKLERSVSRVENKQTPPILIEPDPEVVALQATVDSLSRKLDDNAATITRLTGSLEDRSTRTGAAASRSPPVTHRHPGQARRASPKAHLKDIDLALGGAPPPPPSKGDAESDFEQAFNLLTSGQVDDAERAFTAFTRPGPGSRPQLPEAWFRLGQIRTKKKDTPGANRRLCRGAQGLAQDLVGAQATVKLGRRH